MVKVVCSPPELESEPEDGRAEAEADDELEPEALSQVQGHC